MGEAAGTTEVPIPLSVAAVEVRAPGQPCYILARALAKWDKYLFIVRGWFAQCFSCDPSQDPVLSWSIVMVGH